VLSSRGLTFIKRRFRGKNSRASPTGECAHGEVESVDLSDVERCLEIYVRVAGGFATTQEISESDEGLMHDETLAIVTNYESVMEPSRRMMTASPAPTK
jgi:hypothetical protein